MNLNFMLVLLLILAWRVAGYYGIDSYLLPLPGTPWTGTLAHKKVLVIKNTVPNIAQ